MKRKRQGILAKVNELYESGVIEVDDIIEALKAEGLTFSPASVKTQVYKLRKADGSATTGGGKRKRFRRLPKKASVDTTPTGPVKLVRFHWMQTTHSRKKGAQIESYGNVICLRLPDSRKYCKLIPLKSWGLKIVKVPKSDEKYMQVFEEVASEKTLGQFRDFAQRMGCTISAGRYIGLPEGVRKSTSEEDLVDDVEEEVA